jgi:hypothetical protein
MVYPCVFVPSRLTRNAFEKIYPTDLRSAYTALALTREGFEELRTFEM